ncbi:MAG: hypothetical protein ACM34I_04455 [bacterium]
MKKIVRIALCLIFVTSLVTVFGCQQKPKEEPKPAMTQPAAPEQQPAAPAPAPAPMAPEKK